MSKPHRVLNLTKGIRLKYPQALRAIENCAATWVVEGEAIRDLTLAESIAKRNEQARNREPLPLAEIYGLTYDPPASDKSMRERYPLIKAANLLCAVQ
jgi:hypothetical protein